MSDLARTLGTRWFEEVWNQGRREAIAEMLAPNGIVHEGATDSTGPDGFYPFFDRIRASFSDLHVTVNDCFTGNDKACVRWTCTAKHTGDGLGIPPKGAQIHVTGITVVRAERGKIVEAWQNWDMLGMMEQIQGRQPSATYIGAA